MKLPKITILLILLISLSYQSCAEDACISCPAKDLCAICHRTFYDSSKDRCGESSTSRNIRLVSFQNVYLCEEGYVLIGQDNDNSCKLKGKMPNCAYEYKDGFRDRKSYCLLCKGGFPINDYQECKPFDGEPAAENCLIGSISRGKFKCYRCEPGYTSSVESGLCYKDVVDGCAQGDKDYCIMCDFYDNYSADGTRGCRKVQSGEKSGGVGVAGLEMIQKVVDEFKGI
jgi:hypothetical protein